MARHSMNGRHAPQTVTAQQYLDRQARQQYLPGLRTFEDWIRSLAADIAADFPYEHRQAAFAAAMQVIEEGARRAGRRAANRAVYGAGRRPTKNEREEETA